MNKKTNFVLVAVVTMLGVAPSSVTAALTIEGACSSVTCTDAIIASAEHWPRGYEIASGYAYEDRCYYNSSTGGYAYARSALTCPDGYELTSTSYAASTVCTLLQPVYYMCAKECADCTDCESDTDWVTATTSSGLLKLSHQQKVIRACDCGTCVETPQYRCNVGYYGSPVAVSSGCTRCPSSGGVYGTTDSAGSTAITDCFIPADSNMTDDTGTYHFADDCYYSN